MKITGSATLHAPRNRVWAALNDPEVLVRTIPGCQELRTDGQDSYRMTLTAGVASIKGTYQGSVKLTAQVSMGSVSTTDEDCLMRLRPAAVAMDCSVVTSPLSQQRLLLLRPVPGTPAKDRLERLSSYRPATYK